MYKYLYIYKSAPQIVGSWAACRLRSCAVLPPSTRPQHRPTASPPSMATRRSSCATFEEFQMGCD